MKRNWYALLILVLLAAFLTGAGLSISRTVNGLEQRIQSAYDCARMQNYEEAQTAFEAAADEGRRNGRWLLLLVRHSLVDQLNQTLATLPGYAIPDNQADLEVEVRRAMAQLRQLKESFLGCF